MMLTRIDELKRMAMEAEATSTTAREAAVLAAMTIRDLEGILRDERARLVSLFEAASAANPTATTYAELGAWMDANAPVRSVAEKTSGIEVEEVKTEPARG